MLIEFIHEKGMENFENGQFIGTNITVKIAKADSGDFDTFIVF